MFMLPYSGKGWTPLARLPWVREGEWWLPGGPICQRKRRLKHGTAPTHSGVGLLTLTLRWGPHETPNCVGFVLILVKARNTAGI